jgi:hypothetical protein
LWNHECPGVAHVELKRLVQKIIDEILSLPESLNLGGNNSPGRQQEEALPYFDPKKYEELLATAVINKVIAIFLWQLGRYLLNRTAGKEHNEVWHVELSQISYLW